MSLSSSISKHIARALCISLASLTGVCLDGRPSSAQTTNFTGGIGDWFNGANWDNGAPGAGLTANVANGGTAQIAGAANVGTLTINEVTGSGTVILKSGTLTATTITIGTLG